MLFFIENGNNLFSHISKNISGIVYVKFDNNIYFPDKDWDDIITMILDGWTYQIIDFLTTKSDYLALSFYDGSFDLKIFVKDNNYYVNAIHNEQFIVYEQKFDLKEFLLSFIKSANSFLTQMYLQDIFILDKEKIINNINKIKKYLQET